MADQLDLLNRPKPDPKPKKPGPGGPFNPHFNGPDYNPVIDFSRLTKQHERIRELMRDGKWRTLAEIETATGDPPASVSAQLRHLRKVRFGAWEVDKRRRATHSGLWEYRLSKPEK